MNNGYEKSKDKLSAHVDAQKKERELRAMEWKQQCPGCDGSVSYENRRNKFCSHSCAAKFNNSKHYPIPLRPRRPVHKQIIFNQLKYDSSRRRWLIRELGYICQICGITEWRGQPSPVVMDHIDGNAENNVRENLRLVCPNCNAQLPTFAGRNKGHGRKARQLRRQKEKLDAAVAQSVEHHVANVNVTGSNPVCR